MALDNKMKMCFQTYPLYACRHIHKIYLGEQDGFVLRNRMNGEE